MVYFFLLKSFSAGHPISRCLQYLQNKYPLVIPAPVNDMKKIIITKARIVHENSWIKLYIPKMIGMRPTKKSGIILIKVIFLFANCSGLPFLQNIGAIFPFPKPHSFP